MLTKRKADQEHESNCALALDVLVWIVADEDRLLPFLAASGSSPETLRAGVGDPAFLAGVLDYLMSDEAVLLACADALGSRPARLAAVAQALSPQPPDEN